MTCILAVDVGTQSLKASVVEPQLKVLESRRVSYTPVIKSKNQVEIDAEVLWQAFIRAVAGLTRKSELVALSFSTLCPSLLALNGAGEPMSPVILHLDRRSYRQALWALERVGEERFLAIAGNLPIPGGISVTSLLWIKEHAPGVFQHRDVVFGHVVTFFMKRLTGRFLIDPSNASFTGLYDTVGYSDWSDELLNLLEVPRKKLPGLLMSPSIAGELDRKVATMTDLPSGLPVIIGANDTTCAAAGAGVTEPGMLMNTSGTVEIMVLCLDRALTDKDHLLRTHAYPNRWLAMRTVGAGGGSIEWFRKTFCPEMSREQFYERYLPEALSRTRTPEARFQPFLSGDRHRIRQKTGSFTRLTLNTTREDCLLALAHGIVSFQIQGLNKWRHTVPLARKIYHVGGGASDAYTRYKQDHLKDFEFIQLGETAVIGAARLAFETLNITCGDMP